MVSASTDNVLERASSASNNQGGAPARNLLRSSSLEAPASRGFCRWNSFKCSCNASNLAATHPGSSSQNCGESSTVRDDASEAFRGSAARCVQEAERFRGFADDRAEPDAERRYPEQCLRQ